jgi:CheY-like chemotaxis protein
MKILIVDDESTTQAVLRKIVTSAGEHQVTCANDGDAAWALLDDPARYFDVVFLDISMPGLDGLALLQRMRSASALATTEVVLCTGANDRATIARAIQLGVRHYVVKPCTDTVITAKLSQFQSNTPSAERRLIGV